MGERVEMSFGFKNIVYFFCDGGGDIVKGARAVANVMVRVVRRSRKWRRSESCFFPQAVALERGLRRLGLAAQAVKEAGDVAEAKE